MSDEWLEAIQAELARLGLPPHDLPGIAFPNSGAFASFLDHLRALPRGSTWADVFPGLASTGPSFDPPFPYRPLGSWDHQALPTGPAIHVLQKFGNASDWLELCALQMRAAGHPVHGSGRTDALPPDHGFLILRASCSEDELENALHWLHLQDSIEIAAIPRTGWEFNTG